MNIVSRVLTLIVFLTSALVACATEPVPNEVEQLRWVERADPIADAKQALRRRDLILLGVKGYTWSIPGVEDIRKFEYQEKFGVKIIEGTGDFIRSAEHRRLITRATEYARTYNLYLLARARAKQAP